MSYELPIHPTLSETQSDSIPPPATASLVDILLNSIVLTHTAPYLSISSLLNLAATSRTIHDILHHSPGVFRHLDLSTVKAAQFQISRIDRGGETWRNVQLDEHLTEDEFYSGPLRGVFSILQRRDILRNVQTLILDGLSVTSDLCHDIINDPSFNVRILSIRDVKNLNHGKLRGTLQYACRPNRPEGMPKLQALYVFGSKGVTAPATTTPTAASISAFLNQKSHQVLSSSLQHQGDPWWSRKGKIVNKRIIDEWIGCLQACEGIVAFDAVLCKGPRHSTARHNTAAVATFAVPPCKSCNLAPEGIVEPNAPIHPAYLPLLSPPPIMSSSLRAATKPIGCAEAFVARCFDCLRERYCASCNKWWCESCYTVPSVSTAAAENVHIVDGDSDGEGWNLSDDPEAELPAHLKIKARISKSCWECGSNCEDCITQTQKCCKKCRGGYCTVHNEGSCSSYCDWCVSRGRGLAGGHQRQLRA
ncbi:hypothetical protein S40288_01854 [Stachybotrys chartarum IBT 40288]|nr:hypothetical protein S40288_01854 [Stachybotrys chartarum IBT 40288]